MSDKLLAGVMRAATILHVARTQDDGPGPSVERSAQIFQRESGLLELVEAAECYRDHACHCDVIIVDACPECERLQAAIEGVKS